MNPKLVVLGGFLGAGKTTLILSAARLLKSRGLKAAAILNDQGSELVDTRHALSQGLDADEVTGGCFCCRFSQLIEAADRLRAYGPDVIFAEAVGSCTDISATTLQPLKLHHAEQFRLAPYSVLVDPQRGHDLLASDADPHLAFLFQKQIDEADLLSFTKSDLQVPLPHLTGSSIRSLSPLTGDGVGAWLDEVLAGHIQPGIRVLDIDYERYAQAEASLAWLNCSAKIQASPSLSPSNLVGPLLEGLDQALTLAGMCIVHLKLIDICLSGYLKASVVKSGTEPAVEGMLDASPSHQHELLLNIRATGQPDLLQRVVESQLRNIRGQMEIRTMECFCPAAPRPEFRYA